MAILIDGIAKSFGRRKVLDNISFEIRNGEVVGYVGLNGAGKTTTIRIAVGVLPPDAGDVLIDGHSVVREKREASRLVGWVPEAPIFDMDARALDYFVYLAGYYGIPANEARRMGMELLEELGLGDSLNLKLGTYSQGMRKRFALAVSMINDPPNFIFDEVLNGLDPAGIAFFRDLALKFKRQGKAVLFSSHILSEVEALADRVVFIHRGRIVGMYSMEEIVRSAGSALMIRVSPLDDRARDLLSKYGEVSEEAGYLKLRAEPARGSEAVAELARSGYTIVEVKRESESLERFFFDLIRKEGEKP
ncbi:MAG: ABC transporter ATP-binding protein [Desulfurococcaceae archaeon]